MATAADYDDWAALGNPGWSYEDVLPLFRRSEDQQRGEDAFHGSGGELTVSDLASPGGFPRFRRIRCADGGCPEPDFNGASQDGAGLSR